MNPKWLIGLAMLWLILSITSNIIEEADPISSADLTVWDQLTSFTRVELTGSIGDAGVLVSATGDFVQGLWHGFWFDYSFTQDTLAGIIFRYFCICLSVGVMFTVTTILVGALRGS